MTQIEELLGILAEDGVSVRYVLDMLSQIAVEQEEKIEQLTDRVFVLEKFCATVIRESEE